MLTSDSSKSLFHLSFSLSYLFSDKGGEKTTCYVLSNLKKVVYKLKKKEESWKSNICPSPAFIPLDGETKGKNQSGSRNFEFLIPLLFIFSALTKSFYSVYHRYSANSSQQKGKYCVFGSKVPGISTFSSWYRKSLYLVLILLESDDISIWNKQTERRTFYVRPPLRKEIENKYFPG